MFLAGQHVFQHSCRLQWLSHVKRLLLVMWFINILGLSAFAAERYWIDTGGGPFNDTMNWSLTSGGVGGASVPGAADIANFTLNNTYMVTFAGAHANTDLDIEYGTVTFDLTGNTYTLTSLSAVDVGNTPGQTARLTVQDGTLAVDNDGDLVRFGAGGATSYLTVSTNGRIGGGTVRPDIHAYSGTLTVDDNGRIDGRNMRVGSFGTGTATITGPNAVVDLSQDHYVGYLGVGTCNVQSGGTLLTGYSSNLGFEIGDNGTVNVNGTGSSWTISAQIYIGYGGDGLLAVSSGGRASSGPAYLGSQSTGVGAATVTGAGSWWNPSTLFIGNLGTGTLTVSSGGRITSTSANLGYAVGSEGRATVSGTGSQWETGGYAISVGQSGNGELTVMSGGEVSAGSLTLGSQATGGGDVTVSGSGTRLALSGSATVSSLGYGTLTLVDSGEMYVADDFAIGDPTGAPIGTLSLDGGSLYVGDDFTNSGVFHFSDGLLRVVGDFQPSASAAAFTIDGGTYEDLPTLDLIGSGTSNITTLTIGDQLCGQLLLREGRLLDVGLNSVDIGAHPGSQGIVTVENGGRLFGFKSVLAVGGSGAVAGGAGTLTIDGGSVEVSGLRLHPGGTVNLNSGELIVDSILTLAGNFNWTEGRLKFNTSTVFTDSTAQKLLGADKTLRAEQSLATSSGGTLTLGTSVAVDGGAISAGGLINQNTLDIRSGLIEASGTASNTGLIQLGGPLAVFRGGTVSNSGTIRGTGTVSGGFTNNATGQVEVLAGERLILAGASSSNLGHVSVIGGELQVDSPFTNHSGTGLVSARDAILRFANVTNNGSFAFSNGTVDVYGDIAQNVGGRITVSNGGIANFYDDVTLATGAANVQATALGSTVSRVVFFGSYNGGVSGGGQAFIEGDHRPGASPGLVEFEGDVAYGPFAKLEIELAGTGRGEEFDALDIAGVAALSGTLEVVLQEGFTPVFGDTFELINASEGISGAFDHEDLPDLGALLDLRVFYDASTVTLAVMPALSGDYNADGNVDAADYVVWRNMLGQTGSGLAADGDGNLVIDGSDLMVWRSHFGQSAGGRSDASTNASIPEPVTCALVVVAFVGSYAQFWGGVVRVRSRKVSPSKNVTDDRSVRKSFIAGADLTQDARSA